MPDFIKKIKPHKEECHICVKNTEEQGVGDLIGYMIRGTD